MEKCKSASDLIQDTLRRSGFVVNIEKSVFDPTNKLVWLGFVWNLQYGRLEVPVQKLDDIKYIASNLLEKKGDITARKLSSFVGKVIALKPSFGNICQLMTRRLSISICCRESWDKKLTIDNENVQELEFWRHNINRLSFNRFMCIDKMPEKIIFSDASRHAGAGFTCERCHKVVHYMWDDIEKCKSSTWRELKSLEIILLSLKDVLSGRLVKIFTDNQNVVRIACKGSMVDELHQLALCIFGICVQYGILLEVQWIPREYNVYADYYSRIFDSDDWGISENIFRFFDKIWGPFTIDVFANCKNKKVQRFFSKYWNPGALGVDAFAHDWSSENCWIVPPPSLVCKVLKHMHLCSAHGTLIIPKWLSSLFWPMVWNESKKSYKYYIHEILSTKIQQVSLRQARTTRACLLKKRF